MKTGIELITEERLEQIQKHGFTLENDQEHNASELVEAALSCLFYDRLLINRFGVMSHPGYWWPTQFNEEIYSKIEAKDRIGQLKVAGALIAAEIDRLLVLEAVNQ